MSRRKGGAGRVRRLDDRARVGLAMGTGGASLILLALVLLAVYRLARTRMDVRPEDRDGVVVPVPPAEACVRARSPYGAAGAICGRADTKE